MTEHGAPTGDLADGSARLPPGRHGLSREFVAENQRQRLLNGVVEAVAEHGYNATTIARIVAAAGISRRTFYEHFEGKEDCFAAAYEMIERHVLDEMLSAPGAGEAAARYREAMQLVAATLRPEPPPADHDMEVRDQALIGGVATLIVRRLNGGGIGALPDLLPDLTELSLAPFMGRDEARKLAA